MIRAHYRGLLDAAPLDDAARDAVVSEARVAFDGNRALFADLAAAVRA